MATMASYKETDESGNVVTQYNYSPFGQTEVIGTDINQPFRFTGREYDPETGLYFYRARYYSPEMRRFISEDPLRFGAGDVNWYTYVGGNPVNRTDPLGLAWSYGEQSQPGVMPGGDGESAHGGIGFGGFGHLGPMGGSATSSFVIDTGGTMCYVSHKCGMFGWNSIAGGSIGASLEFGPGRLCSGLKQSQGIYWYGGAGLGGQGQVSTSGYSRGIVGPSEGAGAGYFYCFSHYYCINESDECNKCQ